MRTNAARKSRLAVVHPSSNDRIEQAALELTGPPDLNEKSLILLVNRILVEFGIRPVVKALEAEKKVLGDRLVKMVQREGEEDEKGKVRYTTDAHRFVVVGGKSVTVNGDKVKQALIKAGVRAKVAAKCVAAGTSIVEYEYVRVDAVKGEE